jgi:pimeloyl-ACP methyl ester carboxylesterase
MAGIENITLQHGTLKFSALTVGSGPLVLCLHGFPDNAHSWRHQLPVLAAAGYRTVAVTLRGYEPASQPADGDYSLRTLARDVIAIIDELGEQKAHLIGHDWGAGIAYTAGAIAPDRLLSLSTLAVPHPGRFLNEGMRYPVQLRMSWYFFLFQLRGLAEHVVEWGDFRLIRKLWRDWSPGWTPPESALLSVFETFSKPGVKKAALSYYRTALSPRAFTPAARAANRYQVHVPTLAMAGEKDGCIDSEVFQKLMRQKDFTGGLEVKQIAGAGHFLHQEKSDVVNRLLCEWLSRNSNG